MFSISADVFAIMNISNRESGEKMGDMVVVYSLDKNIFRDFMANPSIEILESKENNTDICVFTKSKSKEGYIRRKISGRKPEHIDEAVSGYMRIGSNFSLPVYTEFIEFISSKSNIQNIFADNNFNCKVNDYVIVEGRVPNSAKVPVIVWVTTDSGNYYITINEKPEFNKQLSTEFGYILYTQDAFLQKFGLRDGILRVNGKDITYGNYIKFENNGVYMPFRAIMETLGATIKWDVIQNNTSVKYNNKEYVLEVNNRLSLIEVGTPENILMTPPGGSYYCDIIDDRIIMDANTMKAVIKLIGGTVNINYNNMVVEIDSE